MEPWGLFSWSFSGERGGKRRARISYHGALRVWQPANVLVLERTERDLQGNDTVGFRWDFVGGSVVMEPFVRETSVPA